MSYLKLNWEQYKLKYQRFVSLCAGLSFVVLFISSGVLYFIPDRKVTSWTDWAFLGLDKQQWDNLHINLGIFFLVMIVWHIYFNWKPIKNYLKVKKSLRVFTREFNFALFWVTIFFIGTATMTIPLSILVNLGNGIKAINALSDGNPPFGYAEESSFRDFCILLEINEKEAITKLEKVDVYIASDKSTLKEIAKVNNISPKNIYLIIRNNKIKLKLPNEIPIGIAHKSIDRLSQEYQISVVKFISHLKYYDITIDVNDSFKKIAHSNDMHPAKFYSMLLASQKSNLEL
jgi:DNA-binding CsgD family transcriptional regulator